MCTLFIAILVLAGIAALVMSGFIWAVLAIVMQCWPVILVIVVFVMWRKAKKSNKSKD